MVSVVHCVCGMVCVCGVVWCVWHGGFGFLSRQSKDTLNTCLSHGSTDCTRLTHCGASAATRDIEAEDGEKTGGKRAE